MSRLAWSLALPMLVLAVPLEAQMPQHVHGGDEKTDTRGPSGEASNAEGTAPQAPADHAADRFYDPAEMAEARRVLAYESGSMSSSQIMIDQLESRIGHGSDLYHWEGEGYVGGDLDRLMIKTEGEGGFGGPVDHAEVQALYSRAISPYLNLNLGLRHDFRPSPQRSYVALGVEGLAPYWLHISLQLFVSDKGKFAGRAEASYDQRLTQRLIVQPSAEINVSAQGMPAIGKGSGVTDIEAGFRLRYEIVPEFAPYVGLIWERKFGDTARYARHVGEERGGATFVAGLRMWF